MKDKKAEGRRQKAAPRPVFLLPTAFCLLPSLFDSSLIPHPLANPFKQRVEDTVSRVAVPERRDAQRLFVARRVERVECRVSDLLCVCADDDVRSHLDCHGTLRVLTQGETGNSERGRLLLNAAGIREHETRAAIAP